MWLAIYNNFDGWIFVGHFFLAQQKSSTLPETKIAPGNRPSQKETSILTILCPSRTNPKAWSSNLTALRSPWGAVKMLCGGWIPGKSESFFFFFICNVKIYIYTHIHDDIQTFYRHVNWIAKMVRICNFNICTILFLMQLCTSSSECPPMPCPAWNVRWTLQDRRWWRLGQLQGWKIETGRGLFGWFLTSCGRTCFFFFVCVDVLLTLYTFLKELFNLNFR